MMIQILRLNERLWPLMTLLVLGTASVLSLMPPGGAVTAASMNDKVLHCLAHAAIAAPVCLARPRGWLWLVAGFVLWGVAIEIMQPLVGRDRSAADVVANLAGTATAVAASGILRSLIRLSRVR
ncbi:MAG TPA: VanZ family protein [Paracoccaceae bacterium]|nr:VanZ family protein [Paracoccaceae bacterium]